MRKRGSASGPSSSSADVDENANCKRSRACGDESKVNGVIVYTRSRKLKSDLGDEARDDVKIEILGSSEELRVEDPSVSEGKRSIVVEGVTVKEEVNCELEVGVEQDFGLTRTASVGNVGEAGPSCEIGDRTCAQTVDGGGQWQNFDKSRLVDIVVEDEIQEGDLGFEGTVALVNGSSNVEFVLSENPVRHFIERTFKVKVEVIGSPDNNGLEADGNGSNCNLEEVLDENGASTSSKKNLELKMSKKIVLDKIPTTVRELFETGLLEGVPVIYMGGKEAFRLLGTIKDTGILCWCSLCRGSKVIPHSQFEIHACKTYKRAAQYICFENGKSLLEVLKLCRDVPLHMLEATIHSAISYSSVKKFFTCERCRGSFAASTPATMGPLCDSCMKTKEPQQPSAIVEPAIINRLSEVVLVSNSSGKNLDIASPNKRQKTTVKISKPLLVPKSSKVASRGISSQYKTELKTKLRSTKQVVITKPVKVASLTIPSKKKAQWKITKKDQRFHRLVFEKGGLPDGTEVAYYARGKKLLEGYKKGYGIFCLCCNAEVSPSQFEVHAGWASRKKPYSYIYTSNGVSLHELAISLSKGRKFSAKDNDDLCIICADGGDLVLCDGCPRAFHKECASLSSLPRGKWYCRYCQNMLKRERFVVHNANAVAAGRVEGVDPIEQITKRCIRIAKNIEAELSGCALCRAHDFSRSGFGPRTIIICDQCEKEYHVGCLREHKIAKLKEIPKGKWFCCINCKRIHSTLSKLVVRGFEKIPESLLTVVQKKFDEKGLDYRNGFDVRWKLVNGNVGTSETRLLLSQALDIFHECFDPIVDKVSGRDLIPLMVHGRNVRGQEFGGLYCAVLMVNSSVVSAVLLRVFGQEAAELPLVATRKAENGKGFFQLLFSCIEKLLAFMNVKNIVLPAAEEAESIWTQKFGFRKLTAEEVMNLRRKCWQIVTFKGTCMLQKPVHGRRNSSRTADLTDISSSM